MDGCFLRALISLLLVLAVRVSCDQDRFCFPTNMHRGESMSSGQYSVKCISSFNATELWYKLSSSSIPASCDADDAYVWVPKGGLIPCSPVCQLKYRFTNERYISARRIYEVCRYDTEKKMFYHDIADRDRWVDKQTDNRISFSRFPHQQTRIRWIEFSL